MLVAPSLLSADFGNLEREMQWFNQSRADLLHLDVMDGVFVPNISFGFPVLKHVACIPGATVWKSSGRLCPPAR